VLKPLGSNHVYCRAIDKLQVVDLDLSLQTEARTIYITPQLLYQPSVGRPRPIALWFNRDTYRRTLPSSLNEFLRVGSPHTGTWNPLSYVLRREDGCGLFNAPGYASLYYQFAGMEDHGASLKIVVSPVGVKGTPQVGLCKGPYNINKIRDLPNTLTVVVDGYSINITALVEKKMIMNEVILEVSLLMQCSKERN
jgi:hypothetical protein